MQTPIEDTATKSLPTPSESSSSVGHNPAGSDKPLEVESVSRQWEGYYVSSGRSDQQAYYGPSSMFYFMSRIGAYLGTVLSQPFADQSIQLRGVNKPIPTGLETSGDTTNNGAVHKASVPQINLPRVQEEYFISLFWESWYCSMPIIDEGEFRRHYVSLWEPSRQQRKQSALVDIILALSLQYGMACVPRDTSNTDVRSGDATLAGRWYYRRCQSLLALEQENPSILTVQCHIYSSAYLCCASFQNMAHTTIALAVRTAQILGLHLEPPSRIPLGEKELRKRIWWVLLTLESKACMKLGRPFSAEPSQTTVALPLEDLEAASLLGGLLGSHGSGVTWLTYLVECQKLIYAASEIYRSLYANFSIVLSRQGIDSPYKDPKVLEICAEFLTSRMYVLQDWLSKLPHGMIIPRRGSGSPYSIDRTPLEIDVTSPLWLLRQRIWLELLYHTMSLNLYRPFITFGPSLGTYTPVAGKCAVASINHALAHTHIMHQVLSETDLLTGWQESFQWQWNATVTIIGFVLAYPIGPSTPAARKGLDEAIAIFEIFERSFANASCAITVTREMACKADMLASRFGDGLTGGGSTVDGSDVQGINPLPIDAGIGQLWEDMDGSGSYSEFMDWAMAVDTVNNFGDFYSDTSNLLDDSWAFNQPRESL